MDNVYVLYQSFETMKDTDITIHESFESKTEALIQMDNLISISKKSHEGSIVQSFDHDDEKSKQVTDQNSFWDVYIVKTVKFKKCEIKSPRKIIEKIPTEILQTCDHCGNKGHGYMDIYFGQGYGSTLCPACYKNIAKEFEFTHDEKKINYVTIN